MNISIRNLNNTMEQTEAIKKMECVDILEEQVPRILNTGTFCCKQCGVFDLNGYRNRLTPQLACIAEDEEVSDADFVEEDAILGVLRKAPVVECFHCAQTSEAAKMGLSQPEEEAEPLQALSEEEMQLLALEEEAALLMLNELQKSLMADDDEDAIEEGSIVALEDAVVEKSSVSWDKNSINILDGFYSYEDVELLDGDVQVEKREVGSFMSSACDEMDLESLCESLKDIASEFSDEEDEIMRGKTLFDVETVSVHSAQESDYASVQSASAEGSESARDFASCETRAHGAAVYLRLSSFADERGETEVQESMQRQTNISMETTLNNNEEEMIRKSLRVEAVQALETKTVAAYVHLSVPTLAEIGNISPKGKLLKLNSGISNVSTCDDLPSGSGSMSFDSTSC